MRNHLANFNVTEDEPEYGFIHFNYKNYRVINGIERLFDSRYHIVERIWWAIWITLSLIFSIFVLLNAFNRWYESPLIVNLVEQPEPIWELPFPAITVCPDLKSKQGIFNFTQLYHKMSTDREHVSEDDIKRLAAVAQVCDSHLFEPISFGANFTDLDIFKQLEQVAPSYEDETYYCKWRNEPTACNPYFSKIWTDEGLCYTFNLLNVEDIFSEQTANGGTLIQRVANGSHTKRIWTLENGYTHNTKPDPNVYPYQIYDSGSYGGFVLLLKTDSNDFDYLCRGPVLGYKVLFHSPGDIPQIASHYIRIPLGKETIVTVDPQVVRTAESLRKYTPNTRGCYYNSERRLQFFNEYTQRNCETECLANFMLHKCGCVRYYMPRENSTKICGLKSTNCVNKSLNDFIEQKFFNGSRGYTDSCNCIPTCTQITYDQNNHEISQSDFNHKELLKALDVVDPSFTQTKIFSRLTVHIKQPQFVATIRHELYTNLDLIAICGGTLVVAALFLFTLEIIYYMVIQSIMKKSLKFRRTILTDDFENIAVDN